MNAAQLLRLAVVSIDEGTKLGYVDEVLLDPGERKVAMLRVAADKQAALIPFDQVRSVGRDAITVPSTAVAQWPSDGGGASGLISLTDFGTRKVLDEAGTLLGTVRAVSIDPEDGRITEITAHKGGTLGIGGETHTVAVGDVASIGDEVLVVRVSPASP